MYGEPGLKNLDIDLLRAFATIAELKSFSRAGERLLRSQSALSLQLQRLEAIVGKRLIDRTPRSVRLTVEGETFLADCERILALHDAMIARVQAPQVAGHVRFGTPEDFATTYLPSVLAEFAKTYPLVTLEVRCDLTLHLLEAYRRDDLDLALVKREPAARARQGLPIWREPLVWVSRDGYEAPKNEPVALVVSPEPCVYRKRAITALKQARLPWRVAYTCASLAGAQAAVRAGLGIAVLPKAMATSGLTMVQSQTLPDLPATEIALLARHRMSEPARRLREHVSRSLEHAART